jgi:hypothetical protein
MKVDTRYRLVVEVAEKNERGVFSPVRKNTREFRSRVFLELSNLKFKAS